MKIYELEEKLQLLEKKQKETPSGENEFEIKKTRRKILAFNRIRETLDNRDDFYKVLEVSKTTDAQTMKKKYQRLLKQLHPNFCDLPNTTQAFQVIQRAYEVLSDEKQRRNYDFSRENGQKFSYGNVNDMYRQNYSSSHQFFREQNVRETNSYTYNFRADGRGYSRRENDLDLITKIILNELKTFSERYRYNPDIKHHSFLFKTDLPFYFCLGGVAALVAYKVFISFK